MSTHTRRTITRAAAWTMPVIAVAATAPAYAASALECAPTGYKKPGDGPHSKDYVLRPACNYDVVAVWIDGVLATRRPDGSWIVRNQPDSRRHLPVTIQTANGTDGPTMVAFPPGEDPK